MKYQLLFILMMIGYCSKAQSFRPPGTVQIFENFFFDQNEITNLNWIEYQSWIKNHGPGEQSKVYQASILDTMVWEYGLTSPGDSEKPKRYIQPFIETYHRHSSFHDYPVVGVSYEQAVAYCEWRTKVVKDRLKKERPGGEIPDFRYRLPKEIEWELIARVGFDRPKFLKIAEKKEVAYPLLYNLKHFDKGPYYPKNKPMIMPAPASSYHPNEFEIYHLIGNVAEMVEEKGIAKGGSWSHPYDDTIYTKDYPYEGPGDWLGFRCVCEIMEK